MKRFIIFSVMMVAVASCSKKAEVSAPVSLPENLLATVGDSGITTGDFEAFAVERNAPDTAEARAAILEEMIAREALIQQARAEGLDQTAEYRRAMGQFLITRLEEKKLQPLLAEADEIPADELEKACEQEAPRFERTASRRYAWIRTLAEGGEMAGAESRIQSALRGFRALSNDPARSGFGVVAAEFSDDGNTRYQGGDLGWLTPDQLAARLPLEAKSQIDSLPPGQASETIQLANGFCIVLATGERPAVPISQNDLREVVKYEMINRRRGEARVNFLRKSREGIKVEIHGEKYTAARVGPDSKQSARPPEP